MRFLAAVLCTAALVAAQGTPDPLLSAMKDEVERSKTLEITGLEKPYFIEVDRFEHFFSVTYKTSRCIPDRHPGY